MIKCEICEKELNNLNGISKHIKNKHGINSEEYFLMYLGKQGICKYCNQLTKFKNLIVGYQHYCGLKCSNNDPERKEKFRQSYLSNDMGLVLKKRKKTNFKKYGNENANLNLDVKEKSRKIFLEGQVEKKLSYFSEMDVDILSNFQYNNYNVLETFRCKKCEKVFESTVANLLQRMYPCSCQRPISSSTGENELKEFLLEFINLEDMLFNYKMDNKEYDIVIPKKKFAIEYNGLYWHSENILKNPQTYHNEKMDICNKYNYNLLQIFEDEWIEKNEIVKQRIKHILNIICDDKIVIYARKCIIKKISSKDKNIFLDKFHIQGKDISSINLGAFYNDELLSVMTFSKGNISKGSNAIEGVWELNRFCSDFKYHIPGIAGKLLKYFQRNYKWNQIFSYADRRWSYGNLYYQLGFFLEQITKPNYWYTSDGFKRIHRFNLRKKSNESKNIPEWVLRYNEGYYRIWDCGNFKFSIKMEE